MTSRLKSTAVSESMSNSMADTLLKSTPLKETKSMVKSWNPTLPSTLTGSVSQTLPVEHMVTKNEVSRSDEAAKRRPSPAVKSRPPRPTLPSRFSEPSTPSYWRRTSPSAVPGAEVAKTPEAVPAVRTEPESPELMVTTTSRSLPRMLTPEVKLESEMIGGAPPAGTTRTITSVWTVKSSMMILSSKSPLPLPPLPPVPEVTLFEMKMFCEAVQSSVTVEKPSASSQAL
mmetsp:Transcript_10253/g.41774  ORF Transcript_10253/g.41774 Transcript_10253/m.41774 type:complete len:229 (-) Transcript_10253:905-1591(-)